VQYRRPIPEGLGTGAKTRVFGGWRFRGWRSSLEGCRLAIGKVREDMPQVMMYSTQVCPYCVMAEKLLLKKGVSNLEKVLIDRDPSQREVMMTRTGRRTVPQIYIGETHVGGYDDLVALERAGKLDPLLA
jgi:glutaredoxin 3